MLAIYQFKKGKPFFLAQRSEGGLSILYLLLSIYAVPASVPSAENTMINRTELLPSRSFACRLY